VRIQSLKEVHSVEEPTNPEVEFIIQVSIILYEAALYFCLYCSHISVYLVPVRGWLKVSL
jgi:hypothetical protein